MEHSDLSLPAWQLLGKMPALAHLTHEQLQWLAQQVRWQRLARGDALPEPFHDNRIRWVVQGQIEMRYASSQGKELLLGEFEEGQLFGHASIRPLPPMHFTLKAVQPVLLATLEGPALHDWLNKDVEVLTSILHGVTELLWGLVWRVVEMGTMNVRSRLHMRLLLLAQRQGVQDNQVLLQPSPTQASLAAYLGTSREEVAREMSRLVRLGLLQREGRSVRLCNVDGLAALVDL